MRFGKFYGEFSRLGEYGGSLFLLAARLAVAVGFTEAAHLKWEAIEATAEWFGVLGYPFPLFTAYLVSSVEVAGVVLLALGLLTRLIAVPLMIIMVTAILTVHLPNGFECSKNGFEIPLYYFIFLGLFLSHGPGKYSLDHLIFKGN
ncbi:DoxX family protein [Sulfurimonas sp. HSL-3221]|uniref:HvfX family Cu-binding RiPP maturation protein n=1 Tax=Sulfurimonadaceae TaxID=2771471 RepID=UPI001E63A978|nr:DoxX family protein [Sulfurimonas sp. HSL-3221]UFS62336.1 DoxX family protein [Sulfurimonas sp. HSL-3221]